MKVHERLVAGLVALTLVATACSSGSENAGDTTPAPSDEPTVTAQPTATPDEPAPDLRNSVTDDELMAAAVAQLEADVAADPGPLELAGIAEYDVLETAVSGDGTVTVRICAWNGDTVFDRVRDSLYTTTIADDGTITANHLATPLAPGECLNTELVEQALAVVDEFDQFSQDFKTEPSIFATDPRADSLMTPEYLAFSEPIVAEWVADDITYSNSRVDGLVTETLIEDILWRRLTRDNGDILEFVFCRPMNPDRGIYRDGVLIDDGRGAEDPGLHAVDSFELRRDPTAGTFQVAGSDALVWSDCLGAETWVAGANIWRPLDTDLQVLES